LAQAEQRRTDALEVKAKTKEAMYPRRALRKKLNPLGATRRQNFLTNVRSHRDARDAKAARKKEKKKATRSRGGSPGRD